MFHHFLIVCYGVFVFCFATVVAQRQAGPNAAVWEVLLWAAADTAAILLTLRAAMVLLRQRHANSSRAAEAERRER